MIETVIHFPLIGHSDHECLFWSLLYARSPTLSDKPHLHWDYHKGACDEMVAHLDQVQWKLLLGRTLNKIRKHLNIYYYRLEKSLFPTVQHL